MNSDKELQNYIMMILKDPKVKTPDIIGLIEKKIEKIEKRYRKTKDCQLWR